MAPFSPVVGQFSRHGKRVAFPQRRFGGVGRQCARGSWNIDGLLDAWRCYIQEQGQGLAHEYEGYRPVAVDLTAFWRWRLTGWVGKYFNGIANRMLKGIGFAVVVDVGQLAGQRLYPYCEKSCALMPVSEARL